MANGGVAWWRQAEKVGATAKGGNLCRPEELHVTRQMGITGVPRPAPPAPPLPRLEELHVFQDAADRGADGARGGGIPCRVGEEARSMGATV